MKPYGGLPNMLARGANAVSRGDLDADGAYLDAAPVGGNTETGGAYGAPCALREL